jgi:cytochrome P450
MQWAMAELLNHPEAFHKVRNEIESVTQNVRLVEESDIPNMPYLQAVVKETLRLYPPGPVTTRECNQDCKINGFDIPAKTAVAINLYAIMRDPEIWEDPNEFHPERFLKEKDDPSSDYDYQNDDKRMEFNFVPFGAGRRGCPGVLFSISVSELVLANLVYQFDWKLPDGIAAENLDMSETVGLTCHRKYPLLAVATTYEKI